MKKLKLTLLTTLIGFTSLVKAQLITSNTLTPQQIVQNILLGAGVTASNITFTGDPLQLTQFTATQSTSLGLASGVLISTGKAVTNDPDGPQGPNNSPGGFVTDFSNNGDPDLDAIISPDNTFDAGILEFDFIPQGDSLKFKYVFGSEEYNEYVATVPGTGINDVFAYLLSGPNPAGGNYSNTNIALIPNTSTPISIFNVNNGNSSAQASGPCKNCSYYRDNYNSSIDIQYDGLTTVLTAQAAVNCGQTYHIKIAIADGGDGYWDSGVFLEGGSFSSAPSIVLNTANANSAVTDTLLYEDCNTYCVRFVRTANIASKDSFMLNVGGNAINGLDYANGTGTVTSNIVWPTKILFQANQDTFKICGIKILEDNAIEGLDTLVFNVVKYSTSTTACVQTNTVTLKLYLSDYKAITFMAKDTQICNSVAVNLNVVPTLGTQPYSYNWLPGNVTTSNYTTPVITQPTTFTITVNDICNKPVTKTITVNPTTLPTIQEVSPTIFCLDSIKKITIDVSGGKPNFNIHWLIPTNGIIPFDTTANVYSFTQSLIPSSGNYTVTINDQCNQKDTIVVNLNAVDCTVIAPNVVTANGDGVNDVFKVNGLENFPNSEVNVFNRWGKKVYTSSNYKNDWKPNDNVGTYFYVIMVSDGRKLNGFFQVLN